MGGIFGTFRTIFSGALSLVLGASPHRALNDLANQPTLIKLLQQREENRGLHRSLLAPSH